MSSCANAICSAPAVGETRSLALVLHTTRIMHALSDRGCLYAPIHLDPPCLKTPTFGHPPVCLDTSVCLTPPYVWMPLPAWMPPMFEHHPYVWTPHLCLDAPIWSIQTYRWCPNIHGASKHTGGHPYIWGHPKIQGESKHKGVSKHT